MAKELIMTSASYQALVDELENLKVEKRQEIAEKIRVARGFGDLSENSEYDEAKNEQALVEARIQKLEEQLKNAKVISYEHLSTDTVSIGTTVKIKDMEFGDIESYRIVSAVESSADMDTITDESPVGAAVLGHGVGEKVDVKLPSGDTVQYEILEISI
ncbi:MULTISPECIES: transcription elongation factor GreA [Oscillospiraceae]|uniref:transcription elongation factor GreA n=1 Tax=Oscillospiraceae TaxID=216572 RepID=UPI0009A69D50|nr:MULTISPECIES: transcription elongation factor GreA [Oscillospiraceae]RGB64230.1 transcription elongation factor GreA [Harryflintia acetispora]